MSDPHMIEYVAAGATAVSAVVIAWQAVLTRSSVKTSQAAVAVATRTLEQSQEAVKISQATLDESQIARLEASIPRILMTVNAYSSDPFFFDRAEKRGQYVNEEDVFRLPRDAKERLYVEVKIRIQNDGPGTAVLASSLPLRSAATPDTASVNLVLGPGEHFEGAYSIVRTVENWIRISGLGTQDDTRSRHVLQITYTGPRDSDVVEVHEIETLGSFFQEDAKQLGDWMLMDWTDRSMPTKVRPTRRGYWRSRVRNEKF